MTALPPREGLLIEAMVANSVINSAASGNISNRLYDTFPAVRVTVLGGVARPVVNTGNPEFQIECWGAGSAPEDATEAEDLAVAIEGQVGNLPGVYTLGTIKGAYANTELLHSPDPTTSRERYLFTVGLLIQ